MQHPGEPTFTLKQVDAILADIYAVVPTKRHTFTSRLEQLQRLGIPSGANLGRGKKVLYQPWQLAEMHLACDLLDAGVPPLLIAAHLNGLGVFRVDGFGRFAEASDLAQPYMLLIQLNALRYLSTDNPDARPHFADHEMTGGTNALSGLTSGHTPSIALNLTRQIDTLRKAVHRQFPAIEPFRFFWTPDAQ